MNEMLPLTGRSPEEEEIFLQKLTKFWKSLRYEITHDMDGNLIRVETVVTEEVENLADKPKKELPPNT